MCTCPRTPLFISCLFSSLARPFRSSSPGDDDDFVVPDESDEEARGRSSSRASSSRSISGRSSERSSHHDDDDADEDEDEDEPKSKKSVPKRPTLRKAPAENSSAGNGTSLFLTAAEQRTQNKKTEKKAAEDPFSFLVDVKDVGSLCLRACST